MPSISSEAKQNIQSTLDKVTNPASGTGIPGVVFAAVSKDGTLLNETASGKHGVASHQLSARKVDTDSVFWIASCTKMITGIACMQLVEQGKLELDSHEHLYKLCPELKEKKVLKEDGTLEDRKGEITLRMLLSHTAGFGYTFFNERLRDYGRPTGFDEFAMDEKDYLMMPLVNQPGSRWEYGINIDWAGIAVERVTGQKLDAYFQAHILGPIGAKDISFAPSKHMRGHLVNSQYREVDGSVREADHPARRAVFHADTKNADNLFHAGGAGCFAKPREYVKIIGALLNDGTSPDTGKQILKKETVDEMFTNQIPSMPNFGRQGVPASKPEQTNPIPDLYPQAGNPAQGWGLTFMLTLEDGPTGRGKNTAWWAGIVNLFWWADREKGVGGMIASQLLPFADMNMLGAYVGCEKHVYDGLQK
ncbi:MAG: hypothetical protein M1828_001034 [Chrysothrix sp. TS-e1954]|nr:MAG: hypothetical protein M1828_001034 [Chrysothrix sp. TS-e1954]